MFFYKCCAVVLERAADKVQELVDDAVAKGAKVRHVAQWHAGVHLRMARLCLAMYLSDRQPLHDNAKTASLQTLGASPPPNQTQPRTPRPCCRWRRAASCLGAAAPQASSTLPLSLRASHLTCASGRRRCLGLSWQVRGCFAYALWVSLVVMLVQHLLAGRGHLAGGDVWACHGRWELIRLQRLQAEHCRSITHCMRMGSYPRGGDWRPQWPPFHIPQTEPHHLSPSPAPALLPLQWSSFPAMTRRWPSPTTAPSASAPPCSRAARAARAPSPAASRRA